LTQARNKNCQQYDCAPFKHKTTMLRLNRNSSHAIR